MNREHAKRALDILADMIRLKSYSVTPGKGRACPGMVFHTYVSTSGLAFSETVLVTDEVAERITKTGARCSCA